MLVAAVNCWVTTCRSTDNVVAAAAATDGITATSAVQVEVSAKTKARTGRTRLRFGSCDHIRFMPASISLVFGPTERTTNGRARGTFHVHGRHCSGCIHQIFVHSSRTEEPRQWLCPNDAPDRRSRSLRVGSQRNSYPGIWQECELLRFLWPPSRIHQSVADKPRSQMDGGHGLAANRHVTDARPPTTPPGRPITRLSFRHSGLQISSGIVTPTRAAHPTNRR